VYYDLGAGNDFISLQDSGFRQNDIYTTVDGGLGLDMVHVGFGEDGHSEVDIKNVEYVTDDNSGDHDRVRILEAGSQAALGLVVLNNIETINGSSGNDNILAGSNGGSVYLNGDSGNDTLEINTVTPISTPNYDIVGINHVDVGYPNHTTVLGGEGNDTIHVRSFGADASVDGGTGNDSITIDGNITNITALGGDGNDTIDVRVWINASIAGGDGDDIINVHGTEICHTTVDGGNGKDTITVDSLNSDQTTIVGGAGNDTITITNSKGIDTLMFGNIGYDLLQQQSTNTQGLDHIIGYNWETTGGDPAPVNKDVMNFHDFFSHSPVSSGAPDADNHVIYTGTPASIFPLPFGTPAHNGTWEHGVTVDANDNAGNSLVVLSSNGLTLTAADISVNQAGTIQLNDNARAVVVLGTNQTGIDSGISHFDIYFVQDIDSGSGGPSHQTWHVDQVASVDSLTLVGLNTVYDNLANNWA